MHLKNAITNQYRIEIRNSSPNHKHFKTKFTHTHTPKKKKPEPLIPKYSDESNWTKWVKTEE